MSQPVEKNSKPKFGQDALEKARGVYQQPFKTKKQQQQNAATEKPHLQSTAITAPRPSTYFQTSNSSALHIPLTYSSKTLIGNWQENHYYEQLPRHHQLANGKDYFENRVNASNYCASLRTFNQSSTLQYQRDDVKTSV